MGDILRKQSTSKETINCSLKKGLHPLKCTLVFWLELVILRDCHVLQAKLFMGLLMIFYL